MFHDFILVLTTDPTFEHTPWFSNSHPAGRVYIYTILEPDLKGNKRQWISVAIPLATLCTLCCRCTIHQKCNFGGSNANLFWASTGGFRRNHDIHVRNDELMWQHWLKKKVENHCNGVNTSNAMLLGFWKYFNQQLFQALTETTGLVQQQQQLNMLSILRPWLSHSSRGAWTTEGQVFHFQALFYIKTNQKIIIVIPFIFFLLEVN